MDEISAKEMTLPQAISAFGLQDRTGSDPWAIQEVPEAQGFQLSPSIELLIENYLERFDRTSKQTRRFGLHMILNECLTVMKKSNPDGTGTSQTQSPPIEPYPDIKVFGQISFSHKFIETHSSQSHYLGTTVKDRVDIGIGRAVYYPKFQSLLLVVEAREDGDLATAFPELVVYMGSLHQSRLSQNQRNGTVYGAVSDGCLYKFAIITHEGVLMTSLSLDIRGGPEKLATVLGCLKYILETSASAGDADADLVMDLKDNEYVADEDEVTGYSDDQM